MLMETMEALMGNGWLTAASRSFHSEGRMAEIIIMVCSLIWWTLDQN